MYIIQFVIFVCVISIGVKSKYGSCNGNCTGFIIFKNTIKTINKVDEDMIRRDDFEHSYLIFARFLVYIKYDDALYLILLFFKRLSQQTTVC